MKRWTAFFTLLVLALLLGTPPAAALDKKPISETETVTVKAIIDAIDHESRLITLKGKDGNYETVYAGPEVRRFDELKVGDKVTFKATESIVYQIRKPGEPVPPAKSEEPAIVRGTGPKPGATITQQETATVKVKAVDMKVPSVTVQSQDGHTTSYKIENKGLLKGVSPGDNVVITYTVALLVSVE